MNCYYHCARREKLTGSWNPSVSLLLFIEQGDRCIDCIKHYMNCPRLDLSFKEMERLDFRLWFGAIKTGRFDVLCALLEYGIEGYDEYLDKNGNDSYSVLIDSFVNKNMKEESFLQIFDLLVASGVTICGTVDRLLTGHYSSQQRLSIVCDALINYGLTDETPETLLSYTI